MNQVFTIFTIFATVATLNINQFMGKWYQVYSDPFVKSTFEQNGRCVEANYELVSKNNISVHNLQLDKDGNIQEIYGYAFLNNPNKPGQLTVNLNGHNAPYWVYELGPINNNLYDYAIVSDPTRTSLFVLSRNVERFYKMYDNQVLDNLKKLKFTNLRNKPVKTDQNECNIKFQTLI
jgi:lipocalin